VSGVAAALRRLLALAIVLGATVLPIDIELSGSPMPLGALHAWLLGTSSLLLLTSGLLLRREETIRRLPVAARAPRLG